MVTIKADFRQALQAVKGIADRQIPFATAVTLTRLAQGSQRRIQNEMDQHFVLRSKERMIKGVRIKPAKKRDFKSGNIHSVVRDIDKFMGIHTTGGKKKATKSKYVAVPTDPLLEKGVRTGSGKMKKSWRPASLIAKSKKMGRPRKWGRHRKPKPFVIAETQSGQPIIAIRKGNARRPIEALFVFHQNTDIPKGWPFVETVRDYCFKNADSLFAQEFRKAVGV